MSAPVRETPETSTEHTPLSLGTAAARNLATTTKSVPQMQEISSRWLLRMLPWVQVSGGTYRVNRRLAYTVGDGRVTFTGSGGQVRVIPQELCDLPSLRGFDDDAVLAALADRFEQRELAAGEVAAERGAAADEVVLVAHGKLHKVGRGEYGDEVVLDVLAGGDYLGDRVLADIQDSWEHTVRAVTPCTVLVLSRRALQELVDQSESLRGHLAAVRARPERYAEAYREPDLELAAGHSGEPDLPATFVDYDRLLAAVWKEPAFFLAHPRAIAAFGHECNRRGVYPQSVEVAGHQVPGWRGVPILPCGKIPVSPTNTTSILLMRTGEASQGVVGLHQTGIPDEYQPSLSVRFMGIDEKGIISYLVSAYFSVAVLVPDALGILENVEIGRDG